MVETRSSTLSQVVSQRKIIDLPSWNIQDRWSGIYAKVGSGLAYVESPLTDVHLFTGLGGRGMTMSFGLAEQFWNDHPERNKVGETSVN